MLQAGKNITSANDPLVKIQVSQLYHALRNPKPEIREAISNLRNILTIDAKKYSQFKRRLPYITCGIFNPSFRRTENFAVIQVFILDIDHLSEKNVSPDELKEKLKHDNRIELMFKSPGGDGLKILFRLSERCHDHVKYSMFYKVFARSFSDQYQLNQVIDTRTCDVTRACFISIDPGAWHNPQPETVSMSAFIDFEDPFQMQTARELAGEIQAETETAPESENKKNEIADDILTEIKQKLNPNIRLSRPKQITVPEALDRILPEISAHMDKYRINVAEVKNIHYGKQFHFTAGPHFAVINLFYGKAGFKVVATTKSGSSAELAELSKNALCELLYN